jgi:hypothetical protein
MPILTGLFAAVCRGLTYTILLSLNFFCLERLNADQAAPALTLTFVYNFASVAKGPGSKAKRFK